MNGNTIAYFNEVAIPQNYISDTMILINQVENILSNIENLTNNSPELLNSNLKINLLEIDTKLKKELIKPELNIGYNYIFEPKTDIAPNHFNIQNKKLYATLSMPLFFRKSISDYKIAKAKLENSNYEYQIKQTELQVKVTSLTNKLNNYLKQLSLIKKNIIDNRTLVEAEKKKFSIGESSLFLVNYREMYLLDILEKKVAIENKIEKTSAELNLILGLK